MSFLFPSFVVCAASVFLSALLMNLVRKNTPLVVLYLLQSLAVAFALGLLAYSEGAVGLLWAALLTFAVKVVMAPAFLMQMIRKYRLHFSATSYLNTPLSLFMLASVTAFTYSFIAPRISHLSTSPGVPLLFASIFSVLFLMVNRRGTLGKIIGILSLENGVVFLAALLGVEHTFALEFAIAFDIAVWMLIATAFLNMIYGAFGTTDTQSHMSRLTEE